MRNVCAVLACAICLMFSVTSQAQESASTQPPSPPATPELALPPVDYGQQLAMTMQFIQENMNNHGAVIDRFYYGDGGGVSPATNGQNLAVIADPKSCRFKLTVTHTDPSEQILTMVGSLTDVQKITVGVNANPSTLEIRAPGAVFQLRSEFDFDPRGDRLAQPNMYDDRAAAIRFRFHDPEMAARVGKAAQHALEVCGGGSHVKDPSEVLRTPPAASGS